MHRRLSLLLRRNSPTPVMAHARGISAHTLPRAGHVSRMGQRPNQVSWLCTNPMDGLTVPANPARRHH
jgi:hypothetical protein